MNQEISRVADELHRAADSYTPPPVPIEQLLAGGRHLRRRKQALSLIGTVAVVAAALMIGSVTLPHSTQPTQPATASRISTYDHIRFLRPPGWRDVPVTFVSGAGAPAAYWTNQKRGPECQALPNGGRCGPPIKALHRNGVLVIVGGGLPQAAAPFHPNATVAGQPALIRAADCRHSAPPSSIGRSCYRGASKVLIAEVLEPGVHPTRGSTAVFRLQAYFGPGNTHRLEQQMRHVLATARPTPTPAQPGVVTGKVPLCLGVVVANAAPPRTVKVQAQRDGQVVATEMVTSSAHQPGRYRFTLRPGSYVIEAPREKDGPVTVQVASGATVRMDLPNQCK